MMDNTPKFWQAKFEIGTFTVTFIPSKVYPTQKNVYDWKIQGANKAFEMFGLHLPDPHSPTRHDAEFLVKHYANDVE